MINVIRSIRANSILFALGVTPLLYAANEWESESSFSTSIGYDSNPFKLSDGEKNAFFNESKAGLEFALPLDNGSSIELSVQGRALTYESNASEANRWSITPELRWISPDYVWNGGRIDGDLVLSTTYRDSTFTNRRTGLEATSRGVAVGDRYDSWTYDATFGLRNRIDRRWYFYWDNGFRYRDYRDDFSALGLDRLDYNQFESDFRMKYRPTDALTFNAEIEYQLRSYMDRRARDRDGDRIAGSDLDYENLFFAVDATYMLSDQVEVTLGSSYDIRTDNASGYQDKTTHEYFVELDYEVSERLVAELGIEYIDRSFDNTEIDPTGINEQERSKEAWQVGLALEYRVDLIDEVESWLFAEIRAETVDNSSATLAYDRTQAIIGIEFEF